MHNDNLKPAELNIDVYHAVIEALANSAIFSVTDEKGDIIYANQNFIDITKYPIEELLGQNHRILKSGQQPQEIFVEMWKTISSGKIWRGEVKNRAKDGSFYWVDAIIVPILGPDGKPKNYAALRIVITEKKEIEEKLHEQMQDLERINKIMIGRELIMIELKERIKELEEKLKKE